MNLTEAKQALIVAAQQHKLYDNIKEKGKIVIGKGSEHPEFLFIGEASGKHEAFVSGAPFTGKSGEILSKWISASNITNYAVINAVPIIPLNEESFRSLQSESVRKKISLEKLILSIIDDWKKRSEKSK